MAWHPEGNRVFLVYSADGGDSQVSIMNLNKSEGVWFILEINVYLCHSFFWQGYDF